MGSLDPCPKELALHLTRTYGDSRAEVDVNVPSAIQGQHGPPGVGSSSPFLCHFCHLALFAGAVASVWQSSKQSFSYRTRQANTPPPKRIVPRLSPPPLLNPQGSAKIETVSITQAAAPATSQRMDQKYSQGLVTNSSVATWPVPFLWWMWVTSYLQSVRNRALLEPAYATAPTRNALSFSGATLQ